MLGLLYLFGTSHSGSIPHTTSEFFGGARADSQIRINFLTSTIYAVQLILRGIAIYRTKLWNRTKLRKIQLSSILPKEIDIHFTMKVMKQEEESAEGRGPVYLS